MKLSQNSVSAVFFTTKEGKRNGNDQRQTKNPAAPDSRSSGFYTLSGESDKTYIEAAYGDFICHRRKRNSSDYGREQGTIMAEPLTDKVIRSIGQAAALYHRLVMLVAPAGSGKTAALQEVHERTAAPLFNVNLDLSRRMLDLTERQRALQLPRLLEEIVGASITDLPAPQCEAARQAGVVLLDNIEILFDVSLKQDPLRLLQGLSRNKTMVAAWSGFITGENMVYATPDHPEYRRYPVRDLIVVEANRE